MTLIRNTGSDRVIDELRQSLLPESSLDMASPAFSLFAFAELRQLLENLDACRVVLPAANDSDLGLTGTDADRAFRNRLQVRWLARECARWIQKQVEVRGAPASLPQSILIAGKRESDLHRVITGKSDLSPEMAIRLEKGIGGGADMWLRMQANFDAAEVRKRAGDIHVVRLTPKVV